MRKTGFLVGFGVGYVLGAKAGKERYEQIKQAADSFMGNPKVQETVSTVQEQASSLAGQAKEKAEQKMHRSSDSDDAGGPESDPAYDVVEMPDTMAQAGSNGRIGG